jgi:hypothetical protein
VSTIGHKITQSVTRAAEGDAVPAGIIALPAA